MHSSSADWVLGEARLISSPTTMLANTGPGLNSKSRRSWLYALTPVMSLGSRSGVNWMRRTEQSVDRASALASIVLPTPGTSSISTWPSASRTVSARRTASAFPSMTDSTAVATRWADCTRSSRLLPVSRPVSVTTRPPRLGCFVAARPPDRESAPPQRYGRTDRPCVLTVRPGRFTCDSGPGFTCQAPAASGLPLCSTGLSWPFPAPVGEKGRIMR